jgi:hypothetical protein
VEPFEFTKVRGVAPGTTRLHIGVPGVDLTLPVVVEP